jgi:hypothetical protein
MYKNVLEHIDGIEIFPLISLVVFFVFFLAITIWALKADKAYLKKMSNLPFESSSMRGGLK